MIKRKRKRNPLKEDKKLMRKVAELLAKAIEKEPDGIKSYLLAAELVRRDSLYCEECHSYDIEKDCDWSICYPEMDELLDESDLDMAKEAAEDLAEDLRIVDYVNVFRYHLQMKIYNKYCKSEYKPRLQLSDTNLSNLDLSNLDLYEADLSRADLTGTNLFKTDLTKAKLFEANLSRADLTKSELFKILLSGANLTGANLTGANLKLSSLSKANLTGAILEGTNLTGAILEGTNLTGANLEGAIFKYARLSKSTNFVKALNINKAIDLILPNPRSIHSNDKNKTKKKSRK